MHKMSNPICCENKNIISLSSAAFACTGVKVKNQRKLTAHSILKRGFIWAATWKNVCLGIYGQRRPRSACASAQSDQDPRCPPTELLDTTEYMNRKQRSV